MSEQARQLFSRCETLMLDMDGTLLDLAFDNHMWLTLVPEAYAERHGVSSDEAHERLGHWYRRLAGTLDWYCLDHWSERLDLDVLALHRQHRTRIDFLPGAKGFLETVATQDVRVVMVTNSHQDTLSLKAEMTGLTIYFDEVYTSHDLGHAKEEQAYWEKVEAAESFDPETTLFVDDNTSVLESAERYGLPNLLHVTRPDTSRPARTHDAFTGIEAVADLVAGPLGNKVDDEVEELADGER